MEVPPLHRILYVEDEASMRTIVQVALEDIGGFELQVAMSGAEALSTGPAFHPQLIILDVMMKGMNGPETLLAMRKVPELGETPVLFLTAMDDEDEISHYRELGVVDILFKPIDPKTLAEDIAEIWQEIHEP